MGDGAKVAILIGVSAIASAALFAATRKKTVRRARPVILRSTRGEREVFLGPGRRR